MSDKISVLQFKYERDAREVIDEIEAVTNKVFIDSVHEIDSGILSSSREVIKGYTS
jgi:hypothetical protein